MSAEGDAPATGEALRRDWVRHLAGERLAPEEARRLAGALASPTDTVGPALYQDGKLDGSLLAWGRSQRAGDRFVAGVERGLAVAATEEAFVSDVRRRLPAGRPRHLALRRRAARVGAGLAVATALAAAIVLVPRVRRDEPGERAAAPVLSVSEGVFAAGETRFGPGEALPVDRAVGAVSDRACFGGPGVDRACLGGGGELAIRSSSGGVHLDLSRGELAAVARGDGRVPEIVVSASGASLTVRGGTMAVTAPARGAATFHVPSGSGVLAAAGGERGGGGLFLRAGRGAVAGATRAYRLTSDEITRAQALLGDASGVSSRPDDEAAREGPRARVAEASSRDLLTLADALIDRGRRDEAQGILERLGRRGVGDLEARLARLRRPAATPAVAPPADVVHRVNVCGGRFVAPNGDVWEKDPFFQPGMQCAHERDAPIEFTDRPELYRGQRFGLHQSPRLDFTIPLANGTYEIDLHFAELFHNYPGRRQFDIAIEGRTVEERHDVAREVGPKAAEIRRFTATVNDGALSLSLIQSEGTSGMQSEPILNALEIRRASPGRSSAPPEWRPPSAPLPLPPTSARYRINVGGPEHVDPLGRLWAADSYHNEQGMKHFLLRNQGTVAGTETPIVYATHRWANPSGTNLAYRFPVPPGSYLVRLHFAEISFHLMNVGARVFDVAIEGAPAFTGVDVFKEAGSLRALVKETVIEVVDGVLDIEFGHRADNPALSGIEILPVGEGE